MKNAKQQPTKSGEVFVDPTGARWKWFIRTTALLAIVVGIAATLLTPAQFAPIWTVTQNQNTSFIAQTIDKNNAKTLPPIIGSGILTRIDRVEHVAGKTFLADPFSSHIYREPTTDELQAIGKSDVVLEHFASLGDHQLALTFDDGPDPRDTPPILDILSREHAQATFFVIGENAIRNPALVERIVREGHALGNHTLTHDNLDQHGVTFDREELVANDHLIRSIAGYGTRLWRMPYGDDESSPQAILLAQQLGYVHVSFDVDTEDWQYQPGKAVPLPHLDGKGHVVLFHDGGANRAATIALLPKLIAAARAQGYTFVTLASLVPSNYVPAHAAATFNDHVTWFGFWVWYVLPGKLMGWLFWFGLTTLGSVTMLYCLLALVASGRDRHHVWEASYQPFVSVVIAARNEEAVMVRTLYALAKTDYPNVEIIVVNNNSTDDTQGVLEGFASVWPAMRALSESRPGKVAALATGIAAARGEIIVTGDADTQFEPDAVAKLVRHFHNPRVGAVAGQVKVGNRTGILTAWQALEYLSSIATIRMAESLMNAIAIVPGACAAWRKQALDEVGGFSNDTLAEDCDLTLTLASAGWKIEQESEAVGWTEAPMSIAALVKQRKRWMFGTLQAYRKHRQMVLRPRFGALGTICMPYALASIAVPLIFLPIVYFTTASCLATGAWKPVAIFTLIVTGAQLVVSCIAVHVAHEKISHLWVVFIYRLIYEPLRTYLIYATVIGAIKGRAMGWYTPPRTNTVNMQPTAKA